MEFLLFRLSLINSKTTGFRHILYVKILIYLDEWYSLHPTVMADNYLANDIAIEGQTIFSIPIHQKNENFRLRLFNDSPFPVALNSMMWEGQYSPKFYRRT